MSHLESEIHEQPDVINRLITSQASLFERIGKAVRDFAPSFVSIAARGTSDNAGRYAQYVLGSQAQMPVALAAPSLHTLYEAPPYLGKALVIGISQSGRAEDVRRVLADARQQGALTVSITNNPNSPLAEIAHHHINLNAGEEISVAATKTYTAQLTAVALLSAAITQDQSLSEELAQLPGYIKETLQHTAEIAQWAERYRYLEHLITLGRGYNYCTAFEIGHKIKELCYIIGQEFSEADFRHGPIAMISQNVPAMVVAPKGKTFTSVVDLIVKLREQYNAECLVISNAPEAEAMSAKPMTIPNMPEWLSPIAAVIPGQVFAMRLAEAKGYSLDKPRGLTKVTITQ